MNYDIYSNISMFRLVTRSIDQIIIVSHNSSQWSANVLRFKVADHKILNSSKAEGRVGGGGELCQIHSYVGLGLGTYII